MPKNPLEMKFGFIPIAIQGSYEAHEWSNAGHSTHQEVIGSGSRNEGESALGGLAHVQGITDLQLIQFGSQVAAGDQFKKEFKLVFIGRGDDRVGALQTAC